MGNVADYSAEFFKHPVHKAIDRVNTVIAQTRSVHSQLTSDQRASYARFLRAFRFSVQSLRDSDPRLVTHSTLGDIQNRFQQLVQQHKQFASNLDPSALNNGIDGVLEQLHRLPRRGTLQGSGSPDGLLDDFRALAESEMEKLRQQVGAMQSRIDDTQSSASTAAQALEELRKQFEAQKGRLDDLITQRSNQMNESDRQRTVAFKQEIEKRNETVAELLAEVRNEADELKENAGKAFQELYDSEAAKGGEVIEELNGHLGDAKRIAGLIANTGMASHYQQVANRERTAADLFRYIALGFFGVTVGAVIWIVVSIGSEGFRWEMALVRIGVVFSLLAPAWYCARESSRHRAVEHRTRRIELEFTSINPYLDGLPKEKAEAIIEQLAERYFGAHRGSAEDEEVLLREIGLRGDQLLKLFERIANVVNKSK